VAADGADIFGDGVNVAARLEPLADPGGICLHQSVRDQIRGKIKLNFQDLGEIKVKNIDKPIQASTIVMNQLADAATALPLASQPPAPAPNRLLKWRAAAAFTILVTASWWQLQPAGNITASPEHMALALPDKPSLAVLPFVNMSDDPKQAFFADGMTEDLITDLSRISGLFVVARNSTFVYKNQSVNNPQVAETLGVRYVHEGSVRRAVDQIRVNAQRIDAITGGHIWADRYNGPVVDIFDIRDQFIRKIAKALAGTVPGVFG